MFSASLGYYSQPPTASGGNVVIDGAYTVMTFTTDGNLRVDNGTLTNVQYLLIAGGGGVATAGSYRSGAGAGGVLTGNVAALTTGLYPVTIGALGTNGNLTVASENGGNSTWNGLTAIGGGRGGIGGGTYNPAAGGSGAGGIQGPGAAGTAGQGFGGGLGDASGVFAVGGGGGAGEDGKAGSAVKNGQGGNGIQSNITGTTVYYAGGGGGTSGQPGGGNGLGQDRYGGGTGYDASSSRVQGQPGVLILRWLTNQ